MGAKKAVRRRGAGGRGEGGGGAGGPPGREGRAKRHTPEERRAAVEAFHKSGLTQQAFARQWDVSHVTLGAWVRKHAAEGPQGLERVACGPAKRRGRAPLPAPVRAEVVAVQRRFPDFGLKKIRHFLARFSALRVSTASVRRIRQAEGLPAVAVPVKRKRKPAPPRRFERSRPGDLWQTDITYLDVPWQRSPLYLIAYLDDFSRYVVGHGLFTHQRGSIAVDVFREACARWGKPREVLSDQGRQYFAWRGKTEFQKLLAKEGVAHVVARAHHPMTVGKTERYWETLKRELWDRVHPQDLEEARARVQHFVAHHNHQRPHQSLDGLVPADRFFGVASEVRAAIEAEIAKNELRLALGETPRKPVYLVGQIDGKSVSLHGEQGRLVVQTPDGERQEIEAKDLGAFPGRKEVSDERSKQQQRPGADGAGDDPDADGAAAPGGGPDGPVPASPHGAQADPVRGPGEDAAAGAGPVGVGEPGGPGEGAPGGDGDPAHVAGQGDA
jgi:transposase InsO family protein